jgi:hypothetical protein
VIKKGGEKTMTEKEIYELAQQKAIAKYEGDWEDADKYEREDLVFSEYIKLKTEVNNNARNN